jgi:hypothetical protein
MTQTLIFPLLTTAERNALPSVPDGSTIFNVDVDNLQVTKNNGTTWENVVDSSTSSSPNEVYVSNTGNDTPDAGTIGNPYETLSYALSQITDASSSNPYTVFLVTGIYSEPSLALKAWVNIDGQNSNLTITNPVSADPSFNGGSISRIYNFADLNFVGGANLDFTLSTSIVVLRFENILSITLYTITIQGSSFGTALIVNNWVPLGPEPSLILENTLCLIDNFNLNELTVEKTNAAGGIFININNSQIRGSALFDCSQNQMVLTIKDVNFLGTATYLQTGTGVLNATSVNSFYSSLVVDGLAATLDIDQIEALPSVLNGATVNYKLISDGLLSNYTPLNYTPTSTSVNGALQGIDAAIGSIGVSTLQEAYDAGPTINMDSNVDLEVFSSTGRLGFSVIEGGNTTGVQVNRALQIDYPDIGGPLLFFQHLTPTAPGVPIASIGGQTQANNGFSKSYQSMLVQVVNDNDAAFEAETIFSNIINNAQTNCFKTGTQNVSFRNLNMQSNNIDEVNRINGNLAAGYLDMSPTLLELRAATRLDLVTTAGLINIAAGDINIESQNITTANTAAGSTINTTMENYQLPVNFNTSLIDSHFAYDSTNTLHEYYREDIITLDVTDGSETGQKNFWVSENGSLSQYLRLNGIGQINMYKPLDMGSNDISVIRTIQGSSGYIDFQNFISATAFEIKANGTQDLSLDSTTGSIVLGQKIIYVKDGEVPTSIQANTTYIFLGDRTITSPIIISQPGVTFKGTGRDNSSITMTGSYIGGMIQVYDQDFEINDIKLSAQGDNTYAIYGTNINAADPFNAGRSKTLNITNCQFRNCVNGMLIEGFDLVDVSQTLFYYFQAPSVVQPQFGINLLGTSKVEFTSCEFLRWYDESTNPTPANFFEGNMLLFKNHPSAVGFGAVNLTGLIVHPQQNQNGIVVDNLATFGFANLTSSTFVDGNLNLPTYQPLVIDIDLQPSWIVEANQNTPNLVAFVNAEVNNNVTVTTISAISTPTPFLATTFIDNGLSRVTLNSSTGVITKNSKRPNYFTINLTGQLTLQGGGNNQNLEIGLLANGVSTGSTAKIQADNGVPTAFSYNVIGFATQGDTFQLYVQNDTGANDILLNNLLLAGVEV